MQPHLMIICNAGSGYNLYVILGNEVIYSSSFFGETLEQNVKYVIDSYQPSSAKLIGNDRVLEYICSYIKNVDNTIEIVMKEGR